MELRLVEVTVPAARRAALEAVLEEQGSLTSWTAAAVEGDAVLARALLPAGRTEGVLDDLQRAVAESELQVVVLPVSASIPRVEEDEADAAVDADDESDAPPERVAREELYGEIAGSVRRSPAKLAMVLLSAAVAAAGLLMDDVAIVIGAMVIAPLLGPNVALALATTLADTDLARRAFLAAGTSVVLVVTLATAIGLAIPVDPDSAQIAARTRLGFGHLALALAAGSAGALAFTTGVSASLIGVMVAVALLPPLTAFGLLLGAGLPGPAAGAGLLAIGNLICINLAGVVTFLAQGIRPRRWWEAERAKRASRLAIVVWGALLLALALVIRFSRGG
ncbi:MAG: TIGR00341 family protein [Gemmatimonadota bacterium]